MRLCLVIFCCILVASCSRLDVSDVVSSTAAGAAAAGATAVGLPALPTAILTVTGGVAGGAVVADGTDTNQVCLTNPELCGQAKLFELLMSSVHWIIGGIVFLMVMSWLIPGPQSWFAWRKKDGGTNTPRYRPRSGRRDP